MSTYYDTGLLRPHGDGEEYMARPRAADDFAAIRARMEELRRERMEAERKAAAEPADQGYRFLRNTRAKPAGKPDVKPFGGRGPLGR